MKYTKEQEEAIFSRGQDILVSAGAGAGKTRVLVSRISELILDPQHPISADRLLVLTFTNAAAREMKERIIKELEDRLQKDMDNSYLRKQIRVVKHADISTVHSFCNKLIRTHFNELGLDPSFRIGEEGELKLLKMECMEELLEEHYLKGEESFVNLVECYAPGRDDRALEDMIEKLYNFSRNFANPDGWFRKTEEDCLSMTSEEGAEHSLPIQLLLQSARRQLQSLQAIFEDSFDFLEKDAGPQILYDYLKAEFDTLQSLLKAQSFTDFYQQHHEIRWTNYPRKNLKACKDFLYFEEVKRAHVTFKETVTNLLERHFLKSMSTVRMEQKELLPLLQECIALVKDYEKRIQSRKKEKNIYSFDDLEHFALKLLVDHYETDGSAVPSASARQIAKHYKAIFVDEYQDTNLVQETILSTLLDSFEEKDANLFVVGDLKQSIYRFRQARPDLFLKRYHRYEEGEGLKIELRDNFRSSPDVLNFCNRFFRRWMTKDFGGIDYNDEVCLRAGENGPMKDVHARQEALFLLEDEEKENLSEDLDKALAEAVMIGDKIEALKKEGYAYADMVILLRSIKGNGQIIADYLESRGITTLCESQMGYFQSREIRVILNYLSVIDNLYQDIPMASVMLSGIGGFTSEELAKLKILVDPTMRGHFSLYEFMNLYLKEGSEPDLKEKIASFQKQLLEFRRKRQEMLLHEFIWEIYQETGFYEKVLSMPHGEKRRDNLMVLLKHAEEYEKTMFKGLFYFIRHMEELRTYEIEPGSSSVEESAKDAVRVMTIHKSKGLEYPVVFISLLAKQFNTMDLKQSILYHPTLGIGMDYYNLDDRFHSPSVVKNAIMEQLRKENAEEELRILYVAMTRAKKKLILTGLLPQKIKDDMEDEGLALTIPEKATSFLDWVLPVLFENTWKDCSFYHYHQIGDILHQISVKEEEKNLESLLELPQVKNASIAAIETAFSRRYPYEESIYQKRKFSVSELKKLSMLKLAEEESQFLEDPSELVIRQESSEKAREEGKEKEDKPEKNLRTELEDSGKKPAFLMETKEELDATSYGTLVHKVMELLPFGQISGKKDLFLAIDGILSSHTELSLPMKKKIYKGVESFLFSKEGQIFCHMDRQGKLFKELPFTIGISPSIVYAQGEGHRDSKIDSSDFIVLQGVIDLCGESEDGFWLIDYKTDHIQEGEEDILLDRYKMQMLYYKIALEQMHDKKVVSSMIYSFSLQKFLKIESISSNMEKDE